MTSPAPDAGPRPRDDGRAWCLWTVALVAVFTLRYGGPSLSPNEPIYALGPMKVMDPGLLAHDFTWARPSRFHLGFDVLAAPLSLLGLGPMLVIGRLLLHTAIAIALTRAARAVGLRPLAFGVATLAWLWFGQGLVAGETVVTGFESKTAGYACVLLALRAAVQRRPLACGVWTGAGILFHVLVGVWGAAAVGIALLAADTPEHGFPRAVRRLAVTVLCAVPLAAAGLVPALVGVVSGGSTSPENARHLVTVRAPHHLDAFAFLSPVRAAHLVLVLAALLLCARLLRMERARRVVSAFAVTLAVVFAAGVAARAAGRFGLLPAYPFRVGSALVFLLFAWCAAHAVSRLRDGALDPRARGAAVAAAALGVAGIAARGMFAGGPVADATRFARDWAAAAETGGIGASPLHDAVRARVPPDAVVAAPPWSARFWLYARRPSVACLKFPMHSDYAGWRRRIDAMLGADGYSSAAATDSGRARFRGLAADDLRRMRSDWDAQWYLVDVPRPGLGEPVLTHGDWRLYATPE